MWCVRAQVDPEFRAMCSAWYEQRRSGAIKSENFQLHPPRNRDDDVIRNSCGNLSYPLLMCAVRRGDRYEVAHYDPEVMASGLCANAE